MHDILPNYEVLDFIGRGGMGMVFKARQMALDRIVAVKLLSVQAGQGGLDFAARFKVEAQAMARLSHPGIVPVHDFGTTSDGQLFYVMEFVEGTDLAKRIESEGKLPVDEALRIALAVCEALACAHGEGVVHRDIKPSNILISRDGKVKVADFGLAKIDAPETASLTLSGTTMGSHGYAAPEVFSKASTADHRADIYSLGVLLYQMLTGDLPRGMFKLPSQKVPGLDPRFDAIVCQAMEEDREDRQQKVEGMRSELEALQSSSALVPMPEMRMVPVERPRALWWWLAVAALALMGVLWPHGPEKADEAAEARVVAENRNVPPVAGFGGHRYQLIPGAFTWIEAEANAASLGGHLATLTSEEENHWAWKQFSPHLQQRGKPPLSDRGWWIGGKPLENGNGWQWVTGEPFEYTCWSLAKPPAARTPRLRQHDNGGGSRLPAWSPVHYSNRCGYLVEWDSAAPEPATTPTVTDQEVRKLAAWLFTLPLSSDPVSSESHGPDLLLKGENRNLRKFSELPAGPLVIGRVRIGTLHVDAAAREHLEVLSRVHSISDLRMNAIDDGRALSCVRDLTRLYTFVFKAASPGPLPLPDAELIHLERLSFLNSLRIEGWSSFTGRGLSLIADKRRLSALSLNLCPDLNDEGLAQVARFTGLTALSLTGTTKITDAGLQQLKKLRGLKTLTLAGTAITAKGIADLKTALPECAVRVLPGG